MPKRDMRSNETLTVLRQSSIAAHLGTYKHRAEDVRAEGLGLTDFKLRADNAGFGRVFSDLYNPKKLTP